MPESFNFPSHVMEVRYPESSTKVKFGRGYEFASKPKGPDQITFILHFKAMFFIYTSPGSGEYSEVLRPTVNMRNLENFYNAHKLYEPFYYPHAYWGNVLVRFAKPLTYKLLENGRGQTEPFTIELIGQP